MSDPADCASHRNGDAIEKIPEEFEASDFPFDILSRNARELYLPSEVPRIHRPSALTFLRDFVSQNKPVIITGVSDGWSAQFLWTNAYLRKQMGDREISVAVTPNGRADAVQSGQFVLPEERKMYFSDFLDHFEGVCDTDEIESSKLSEDDVVYVQKQNGYFPVEFGPLCVDVPDDIDFATEAFGCSPDAINFWMGDDRSVSSLHQDPYENIYAVIAGSKHFTLLPPTDLPWLHRTKFRKGKYFKEDDGNWRIITSEPEEFVEWIPVDPNSPNFEEFPKFRHTHPLRCTIKPGELLYLPALWFHEVRQTGDCHGTHGRTIAVNWWYDMSYNVTFNYNNVLDEMVRKRADALTK
eukprot:134888_1